MLAANVAVLGIRKAQGSSLLVRYQDRLGHRGKSFGRAAALELLQGTIVLLTDARTSAASGAMRWFRIRRVGRSFVQHGLIGDCPHKE